MNSHKEYKVFRNLNQLNEQLHNDYLNNIDWELVAVSWIDVEVPIDGSDDIKIYHNPVLLMSRDVDGQ